MIQIENESIKSIQEQIKAIEINHYPTIVPLLQSDPRETLHKVAHTLEKKYIALSLEKERIKNMKLIENSNYSSDIKLIGGIDEVGRGPLAGPVVTCVIILKKNSELLYVNDSKKLSKKTRESLCAKLLDEVIDYEIGIVDNKKIDEINILNATKLAMSQSVNVLHTKPQLLLLDAITINTTIPQKGIIHGDAKCYCIAAASIVAKVYRDNLMEIYHDEFPEYGFNHNMGYGTPEHISAIKKYGPTPIHRKSFLRNFGF
jgi:ribonuclease HII